MTADAEAVEESRKETGEKGPLVNARVVLRCLLLAGSGLLVACGGSSSVDNDLAADDSPGLQQGVQQLDAGACAESITSGRVTIPTRLQNFASECDYFVSGVVSVDSDLTIDAGTTIVMDQDASISVDLGRITAVGNPDRRITIRGEVSLPGYWNGITLIRARPSKIEYVDIMDGGQEPFTGQGAGLGIGSVAISLVEVRISNSFTNGLTLGPGARLTAFSRNRFFGNRQAGLVVHPALIPELDRETDYAGGSEPNGEPVIAFDVLGSIGEATWPALNAPYSDSLISVRIGEELTLGPGVQITPADDAGTGEMSVSGTLLARGTADAPVTFGSLPGTAGWSRLEVSTGEAIVEFDHVVFSDADEGIVLEGSPRFSISNTRFESIDGYAIHCVPLFGSDPVPVITVGENVIVPETADGLLSPDCVR